MKNSQKTTKIIVVIVALIAFAIIGMKMLDSQENAEIKSPSTGNDENKVAPADNGKEEVTPVNVDEGQPENNTPVKESTPEERANRTTSPSEAASYSVDDLPADLSTPKDPGTDNIVND